MICRAQARPGRARKKVKRVHPPKMTHPPRRILHNYKAYNSLRNHYEDGRTQVYDTCILLYKGGTAKLLYIVYVHIIIHHGPALSKKFETSEQQHSLRACYGSGRDYIYTGWAHHKSSWSSCTSARDRVLLTRCERSQILYSQKIYFMSPYTWLGRSDSPTPCTGTRIKSIALTYTCR